MYATNPWRTRLAALHLPDEAPPPTPEPDPEPDTTDSTPDPDSGHTVPQ